MFPKAEDPNRDLPEPIPARMLNEFAYCPRLCYIGPITARRIYREIVDLKPVDGRAEERIEFLGVRPQREDKAVVV